MAKTNLTKVEGMLDQGILKITVNNLLELADIASGMGTEVKPKELSPENLIGFVEKELLWIYRKDKEIFKELELNKKKLKAIFKHPDTATPEEVNYIRELKEKLTKFKKEKLPAQTDDELINLEQKKHINKRHNVNEKWLPLS